MLCVQLKRAGMMKNPILLDGGDKNESERVRLYLTFSGDFNHLDADWEPDPDKAARFV